MKRRLPIFILFTLILVSCKKEEPVASFSYTPNDPEVDDVVNFTNQSEHASTYEWDFGDGTPLSTIDNPTHTYEDDGIYTVQLKATGEGGSNTTSQSITINYPPPVAGFTMDKAEAAPDETITFTNESEYAESYAWDFGDGSTSAVTDPIHSYAAEGIYTVVLTATGFNGETDTYSMAVTCAPPPVADFTWNPYPVGQGVEITFDNLSTNATSYSWDFDDGTTSTLEHPEHTYATPGTYNVQLTANGDGGIDIVTKELVVDHVVQTNIFAGTGVMDLELLETWETISPKLDDWDYIGYYLMEDNGSNYIVHLVESASTDIQAHMISVAASYILADEDICLQINCYENFVGQTEEGIRLGDSLSDIEAAYGPPEVHDTDRDVYWYNSIGIGFFYTTSLNTRSISIYPIDTKKSTGYMQVIKQMHNMEYELRY